MCDTTNPFKDPGCDTTNPLKNLNRIIWREAERIGRTNYIRYTYDVNISKREKLREILRNL